MNAVSSNIEFFGLDVPPEFPAEEFAAYMKIGEEVTKNNSEAQIEFNRAIKATVYRFIAFKELLDSMEQRWEAIELNPSNREIFEQERDLLSLFVFGVSAIESTYYSLYILATQVNPSALDFGNSSERKWRSKPSCIRETIQLALGDSPLRASIESINSSHIWDEWTEYRNQMFHSVAAPRIHRLSVSPNPQKPDILDYSKTWCTPKLSKTSRSFREYLTWLSSKLAPLMSVGSKALKVRANA